MYNPRKRLGGNDTEVVLQAAVCGGGVPESLYDFVPEAVGNVQKVLLRVLTNVRSDFLSNLGVEVRLAKNTACNSFSKGRRRCQLRQRSTICQPWIGLSRCGRVDCFMEAAVFRRRGG